MVFSNSVIEHVGGFEDQVLPVEPHFLFSMFRFLPLGLKVALIRNLDLGFSARGGVRDRSEAERVATSVRLLAEREMRALFPDARLYREKLLGLTKSFILYQT